MSPLLCFLFQSIKRYDSSKARMEAQKKSLLDQLQNENKENEILKEKGWVH